MKLEDILPEIRKGRKFKLRSFTETYLMYDANNNTLASYKNDGGFIETIDLDGREILSDHWELVPEPVRVADYLIRCGWCERNFPLWGQQTHPIGQQPEGSVMLPGSEREQE